MSNKGHVRLLPRLRALMTTALHVPPTIFHGALQPWTSARNYAIMTSRDLHARTESDALSVLPILHQGLPVRIRSYARCNTPDGAVSDVIPMPQAQCWSRFEGFCASPISLPVSALFNLPGPPTHTTRTPAAGGPSSANMVSPGAQLQPSWRGRLATGAPLLA